MTRVSLVGAEDGAKAMLLSEQALQNRETSTVIDTQVCCERDTFRVACSRFSTGVGVLTTVGTDGAPLGLTVNSFTSVSLDPPLILVCVDHRSHVMQHLALGCRFAVSILSEHQRDLSQLFARRDSERFSRTQWQPGRFGVPLFPETLAIFECELSQVVPAGDHTILIGSVDNVSHAEGNGLVYFGSAYRSLAANTAQHVRTS